MYRKYFVLQDDLNVRGIFIKNFQSYLKPYSGIKIKLSYLCSLDFMACTNINMLTSIVE